MRSMEDHQAKKQQAGRSVSGIVQQCVPGLITRIAHSPGTPSDIPPLPPDRDPPDIIIMPPRNPQPEQPEDFPPPVPPPPPAERPQRPPQVADYRADQAYLPEPAFS